MQSAGSAAQSQQTASGTFPASVRLQIPASGHAQPPGKTPAWSLGATQPPRHDVASGLSQPPRCDRLWPSNIAGVQICCIGSRVSSTPSSPASTGSAGEHRCFRVRVVRGQQQQPRIHVLRDIAHACQSGHWKNAYIHVLVCSCAVFCCNIFLNILLHSTAAMGRTVTFGNVLLLVIGWMFRSIPYGAAPNPDCAAPRRPHEPGHEVKIAVNVACVEGSGMCGVVGRDSCYDSQRKFVFP